MLRIMLAYCACPYPRHLVLVINTLFGCLDSPHKDESRNCSLFISKMKALVVVYKIICLQFALQLLLITFVEAGM